MENILATIYLSGLFFVAFLYLAYQINELKDRMKARKRMQAAREPEKPSTTVIDVVGKSTASFLAPLKPTIEPMMSEDLEVEMRPEAESEPDIASEEVESGPDAPYVPDEEELIRYANSDMDVTDELSQGLTFEQISHAMEALEGKQLTENDAYLAGETFSVMPDDFLNVICMQADHEAFAVSGGRGQLQSNCKSRQNQFLGKTRAGLAPAFRESNL
jgi:hypothetical protein